MSGGGDSPRTATLLLLPSSLRHPGDAKRGNAPRVSVGVKRMFTDFSASMSKPVSEAARRSGAGAER
jgi:hypothetical protein